MTRPIILFAYNRPQYFNETLKSLVNQTVDIDEIYLFNDGPRFSQEEKLVSNSIDLFKHYFPDGTVFDSSYNLGVAFNQKRARDFIFKDNDSAIIIEDDVILTTHYISMLNNLMGKLDDGETSMVTCFGEPPGNPNIFEHYDYIEYDDDQLKAQELNKDKLINMEHIWAYGMFKNAYDGCMELMGNYYDMLPNEYRARPHDQICGYFNSKGIKNIVSSQDSCMSSSLVLKGYNSYSTFTTNMFYIGEWGEHSRPEGFRKRWGTQYVYDQEIHDYIIDEKVKTQVRSYLQRRFLE